MRKLHEIAADLKTLLAAHFQSVRVTAIQNQEQFLSELKAINPDKLPGVIIVFEQWTMASESTVRDITVSLVLIDRYVAGSDEKALSVLAAGETLLALFPFDGSSIEDVYYLPTDCVAASVDKQYACLGLRLRLQQGI